MLTRTQKRELKRRRHLERTRHAEKNDGARAMRALTGDLSDAESYEIFCSTEQKLQRHVLKEIARALSNASAPPPPPLGL